LEGRWLLSHTLRRNSVLLRLKPLGFTDATARANIALYLSVYRNPPASDRLRAFCRMNKTSPYGGYA
jgi:hypothetical protein